MPVCCAKAHANMIASACAEELSLKTIEYLVNRSGSTPCLILIFPEMIRSAAPTSNPSIIIG